MAGSRKGLLSDVRYSRAMRLRAFGRNWHIAEALVVANGSLLSDRTSRQRLFVTLSGSRRRPRTIVAAEIKKCYTASHSLIFSEGMTRNDNAIENEVNERIG
jgi:hypothetical protein